MQSLGARLKQEREKRQISLSKIAEETRISSRYLEALEADDLTALPGEFFYRAFVRQYSGYLGLDSEAIDREINVVSSRPVVEPGVPNVAEADPQIASLREKLKGEPLRPPQDDGMSKAWLAFAGVVIAACAGYFAWQNFTPPAASPVAASSPASPSPSLAASSVPELPQTATGPAPVPSEAKPVAESPAPTVPPVKPIGTAKPFETAAPGQFQLTLVAKQLTWIRITADGAKVFGGTIEAGERKSINATAAEVIVGNAGTLDVIYNGKALQYGGLGEVKTLQFNPEGWRYKPKAPSATNENPASLPTPTTGTLSSPSARYVRLDGGLR